MRGTPDHGEAWSRPWRPVDGALRVDCPGFSLERSITHRDGAVVADYRMSAVPCYRFIWAAHALLNVTDGAVLEAPEGTPTRLFTEAAPLVRGRPA
ncbi:hypothetical protein ABZX30_33925 [Streptomyces sp. NPDC004542]|uniref:hypothetical protein n=1 Tax=Streptomyces sp. NPDC004542 TaxID=3154281 RepID=UPI0033A97DC6